MSEALKNIVTEGIKTGTSRMQILTNMLRSDQELDLVQAGKLYNQYGAESGLLLGADAKNELVATVVTENTVEGVLNREAAVNAVVERAHLSKSTAVFRLKAYCEEKGIEWPATVRTVRDMEAVKNAYKSWSEQGYTREQIEAGLIEHFAYTEKGVKEAFTSIGKGLGLIETRQTTSRAELAKWFRTTKNVKGGDKKEIIERLVNDFGGKKATAEARYNMYLFAKEFCSGK